MSTSVQTAIDIRSFHVEISDEQINDLRRRIESTRWPTHELVDDRSQGVQLATLGALADYWKSGYDLGRIEARLNALPQFTTEIDGVDVHFCSITEPGQPWVMISGSASSCWERTSMQHPRQHHAVLADRHGRVGRPVVLGGLRSGRPRGRPGPAAGRSDPGRLYDVPRRDLADASQLAREVVFERRLLQRGRQGRALRSLGGARNLRGRDARSVQVASR